MNKAWFSDALRLLREERRSLCNGELARLAQIADHKEALAQRATGLRLSAEQAAQLRDATEENARLLAAATDGLRAARDRIEALREVRDGLSIYTAQGGKETMHQHKTALERKA